MDKAPHHEEHPGVRYRCPKCKRTVTVMVSAITVTCGSCGETMKRVRQRSKRAS